MALRGHLRFPAESRLGTGQGVLLGLIGGVSCPRSQAGLRVPAVGLVNLPAPYNFPSGLAG